MKIYRLIAMNYKITAQKFDGYIQYNHSINYSINFNSYCYIGIFKYEMICEKCIKATS